MRLLNPNTSSDDLQGCDRLWDDGEDVMVQLRPATAADHSTILPNYVPDGEILGRVSRAALLEAARSLGLA
ncbi:MAG: hypothetical protein ACRDQI_00920 [Pseudonocardiaceae bacterium]